jgi:integrase
MPRRSKGPRFWLRPARRDSAGNISHVASWLILDGSSQHGCGLGSEATDREKEEALKEYLKRKHASSVSVGSRDPSQVEIADVIARYIRDKDPPYETGLRFSALLKFWDGKKLSYVTGDTCRAYAATRTPGAARRELEDFRAAINHHRHEGLHDKIVSVVLPAKSQPREDYLTHQEAAALIRSAWRYREQQNARATDRATRKHVARFMVVARYMGSRAAVICEASIEPKRPEGRAWINLTTGMFYGLPTGQTQTKKRRQLVKVPLALLAHLRRWRKRGQRYVVEWNRKPITKVRKAHDSVVYDCRKVLKRHVSPHIWRHTVATWLMQGGADPFKAAGFLAMTVETLLRVYGHHHPDHSADVHAAMRKKKKAA